MFDPIAYINQPRWHESRLGLDRTRELLDRLGNPQDEVPMVHVAGTNGKGSTCAMLASILQESGYRTGLFTSPYIIEFNDRIRVDGANIPHDDLLEITLQVKEAAEAMDDHPTEFELMTAVAFCYFDRAGCDIAVIEVGLGGRLDSTNVIDPEVCVITSISLDHTAVLGDTLEKIAAEKAGIIKSGVPVVSYAQQYGAADVIATAAQQAECPLHVADFDKLEGTPDDFSYKGRLDLHLQLTGSYQTRNAAVAIEAVEMLRQQGWTISEQALYDGLAQTTWPGRFEIVAQHPTFVVDGGHNPQGIVALIESLNSEFPSSKPVFLVGVLKDKDYPIMMEQIAALGSGFVCVCPPNPRALATDELARCIRGFLPQGTDCSDPVEAETIAAGVSIACKMAGSDGLVVACGSLYSVAEILEALGHR